MSFNFYSIISSTYFQTIFCFCFIIIIKKNVKVIALRETYISNSQWYFVENNALKKVSPVLNMKYCVHHLFKINA